MVSHTFFLQDHMTDQHLSDDKKFHCNFGECKYSSVLTYGMFYHMSSHFEKQEFLCQHCSFTCDNYKSFRFHSQKHNKLAKPRDTRPFICDLCDTQVKLKTNLVRHMRAKHLKRKMQCSLCSHFVYSYDAMQFHKVNKHGLETEFRCETCKR